jgi:hypothetical protein
VNEVFLDGCRIPLTKNVLPRPYAGQAASGTPDAVTAGRWRRGETYHCLRLFDEQDARTALCEFAERRRV